MQALEHPFLKKRRQVPDSAVTIVAALSKAARDADADAEEMAPAAAAAAAAQQARREAAAMKESDQLQVDGATVRQTLEAERWRELRQLVMHVRPPALPHACGAKLALQSCDVVVRACVAGCGPLLPYAAAQIDRLIYYDVNFQ